MTQEDGYILGRAVEASVRILMRNRLDAQHLLWKLHNGIALLPDIPIMEDMKITDLGTGTANLRGNDISSLSRHIKHLLIHQHIKGVEAEEWERIINEIFKKANLDYSWVSNLPSHLQQNFDIIQWEIGCFRPELVQLCTNTYLMALREILQGIKRSLVHDMPFSSTEQEVALYRLSQNTKSCIYNWSPGIILAQKI
ncbi:hypothetical protein N7463_002571 [Penicillium fimorum]|uniref:Uncharacterized protein n=1 Tax=Penicillium fimorum TaxID=1882269 RepID=A0A9X0C942_9EURO|nr:hypothetical protein N7463_002571 [Penicillium fimorum]